MILSGIVEKKRIFLLLILACSVYARAQEFGGNPPSVKWQQINTDTARVIFPAGLEKQALDISTIVHHLANTTEKTIGNNVSRINIVLQPYPTVANGYVALGPFRSEFFLTPRQNSFELGSLPWHKTLALHEYRHVQQYSNFRKGLSKAFYILFGEEGQALANSLSIPDWFYEGDAVYQETTESEQGRGRLPYFFNDYRSLWASRKNYSWMKLRNGSYRDLVPNHYQLGYMLTAYGYEKFGAEAWKNITADAASFKGLIYPFQKSFKRNTNQSFSSFRNEAIAYFNNKAKGTSDRVSEFGSANLHFNANEEFPYWTNDQHVLFLKSDYRNIPAFYTKNISTGHERKIRQKSISNDDYFSYNNGRIVYSAYEPDVRWGWKNYEVIKLLDISNGEEKKITNKTRYLSPDISMDGSRIVAVNSKLTGENELHILDARSGSLLNKIPNPQQLLFTYPKFYKNDKIVAAVRNYRGQMALGIFDMNGAVEYATDFSMNVIGFPQVNGDTISFTMSEGGQDKLFIWANGKVYRFDPDSPNNNTGDYQLTLRNGRYVWTSFTSAGYHLYTGPGTFHEAAIDTGESNFYGLKRLQRTLNLLADTVSVKRPVHTYSKSFKLFNFHSWRPYFSDPEYTYSLISQNILNTLESELYFTYNRNEKFKQTGAIISYGGLFPVISAGGSYTFDRRFVDSSGVVTWNEFNALAGLRVPLSFAAGTFFQHVNLSGAFVTKQVYYSGASKQSFNDKRFNYAEWSVSANNQQIRARQNIYPRFAQSVFARYRHIINNYTAHQLLFNSSFYFPGFFRNHSIVLQASYQLRDTLQQYTFSNSFPISRGYSDIDFPRMWKIGANYHFPIAYPDKGFGDIVYLLRLRGNFFYDYSEVRSLRRRTSYPIKTVGGELYFDTRWWNQLPLSFGFRYSRLLDSELVGLAPNQYEIVLPMNLLSR